MSKFRWLAVMGLGLFLLESCFEPRTAPSPTPTYLHIGPLVFEGLYCWTESGSGKNLAIFAVFNRGDKQVRARTQWGELRVPAAKIAGTDRVEIGAQSECKVGLSLRKGDEGNAFLEQDAEGEFSGTWLAVPSAESQTLVQRLFRDLASRDAAAIKGYLDPKMSITDIATLIAWRVRIDPVDIKVTECRPEFDVNGFSSLYRLRPTIWQCQASVVYAIYSPAAGSGTWNLTVKKNLIEGKTLLFANKP